MRVIGIRGTSGSGKSYLMRKVMDNLGEWEGVLLKKKYQPSYYRLKSNPQILVLGHYETPCGGCDNIGCAADVFSLLYDLRHSYKVALCEGLILSEDIRWSKDMPDIHLLFLNPPLETCISQLQQRRDKKGKKKKLNPSNTTRRYEIIEVARRKLVQMGIICKQASVDEGLQIILNWIEEIINEEG